MGSGRLVTNASQANGTQMEIWYCNGQSNQQWRFNSDGTLTAVGANKCLDVPNYGTANGIKLYIWDCHGGTNQKWTLV